MNLDEYIEKLKEYQNQGYGKLRVTSYPIHGVSDASAPRLRNLKIPEGRELSLKYYYDFQSPDLKGEQVIQV